MSERADGYQGPTNGKTAQTFAELLGIVMHPAFRIGFLDARAGRAFDHDRIRHRLAAETPPRAFERMGEAPPDIWRDDQIEMAQVRYEEGRLLYLIEKPKVRAWGHPDYPPSAIYDYLMNRCKVELETRAKEAREQLASASIVEAMRSRRAAQLAADQLPLFAKPVARSEASPS